MKDAFQKEHEGEDENDWTIGPKGNKVMTQEALQRKAVRDRAISEEVRTFSLPLPPSYLHPSSFPIFYTRYCFFASLLRWDQDEMLISRKQELEKLGSINLLRISRTAWRFSQKQLEDLMIKLSLIHSRSVLFSPQHVQGR